MSLIGEWQLRRSSPPKHTPGGSSRQDQGHRRQCFRKLWLTETYTANRTKQVVRSPGLPAVIPCRSSFPNSADLVKAKRCMDLRRGWTNSIWHMSWMVTMAVSMHYRTQLYCLWLICRWSQEGEYLVSGSDDYRLFIWDAYNKFAVRKVLDTGIQMRSSGADL